MLQRFFIMLLVMVHVGFISSAQKSKMDNYTSQWSRADSFMDKGLPQSAGKVADGILKDAIAHNDQPNAIRARLFLMTVHADNEELQAVDNIKKAESFIVASTGAEKAVWQSVAAQWYWNYFQQNRWKLYQRTALAGTPSADIETWDAPAFFAKIAALYQASVAERETLKGIPLGQYKPILDAGANTRKLRPTLYDLLVFRAISFFENDEHDVIKPADQFQMDGTLWFEDASRFSEVKVKVKDASALHFQALRLYQEILAFHLADAEPDALIDADIQRLDFVHNNSIHPAKDSLYLQALQHIEKRHPNTAATAQVSYLIAVQQMGNEQPRPYSRKVAGAASRPDRNLPAIRSALQHIVSSYPGSQGAANAFNLLQTLEVVSIEAKTEEVNIPAESVKALITYKNASSVYLKVFRVPPTVNLNRDFNSEAILKEVSKLKPLAAWVQELPGSADMEQHSTEIKIDALPAGSYILVTSTKEALSDEAGFVSAARFQVSALSFVMDNGAGKKGYVLHRKTGYPVAGVKARYWAQKYNNSNYRYESISAGSATSDANGTLELPERNDGSYENNIAAITLTAGTDTLQLSGYFNTYRDRETGHDKAVEQTFFFTDRSIYRPGQTIYFKGIMLESSNKGRDNNVTANRKTKVVFYDVNGQEISSLDLTTNEYGSFQGKFTAPESSLGGQMRIGNVSGNAYFSVEEYKRPKFLVSFDTLKGSYALNEKVTVKGFAKAYAGNNIDGAAVKYRVVRRARFPYYWCYYQWGMPSSPETEISNGTATTAADGSFDIDFTAIPDKTINPKTLPVFSYTVYADVTDINGETRSSTVSMSCGYRSMQINAGIAEQSRPRDLKTISVRTENLNGVFTPASVHISVSLLKFPGLLRKRLWEVPDQFVMNETQFRQTFPLDEYKDESNYLNWEKGKTVHEQTLTTTENGLVSIPESAWYQNGWYVVEISGRDAQGNDILEKKYTYVWAPGKKEANQKDIITYSDKDVYEPGEDLELWLATGVDHPYVLRHATNIYSETQPLKIKIAEKDRGGLAFSWLYVSNNRVYTAEKAISVPWSNKDLQVTWGTHRDKLLPGAEEQWTLTITGNKKEKVAAEMLAGMYDASLDAFQPASWNWNKLLPYTYAADQWNTNAGFGIANAQVLKYRNDIGYQSYDKRYDEIRWIAQDYERGGYGSPRHMYSPSAMVAGRRVDKVQLEDAVTGETALKTVRRESAPGMVADDSAPAMNAASAAEPKPAADGNSPVQIRKNLQETAFFFPQMTTDAEGNVTFRFAMPEALTEWKLRAFAHTKDWKTGYLEGKVKTQKDLMVVPNLPRFLRQNDDVVISAKISNLSDVGLMGQARLEIVDAITMQPLNIATFQKRTQGPAGTAVVDFSAAKGQSTTVSWNLHIPESLYTPVIIRIEARAGNFSDGEENTLPVITNRTLVTETLPMPVRGNEEKTFTLDKLLHQQSTTLSNHSLTVEFTGNPAWYAVQALPYLMEYPYECAEQTFNRFYANALAGHIVAQSPRVGKIFEQWSIRDTAALLSGLEKNEELKSALLEETPWVMDAKEENEQKHRIASLFETHKLAKELRKNLSVLEQMQMPEGGFPWFKGMQSDRYITQYIITGIARLQHLGVKQAQSDEANDIIAKALVYLDHKMTEDYRELTKNKISLEQQNISNIHIQYLYLRSLVKFTIKEESMPAFNYYKKQAAKYWTAFNPYLEGQIALSLDRLGDTKTPKQIMASLKETAIRKEEMGMYWKNMPNGYWWYEAPVEAQALLIEAFTEVAKDDASVDAMKVWLLKQKQTQNWKTTKATADACYALLLKGSDWLSNEPVVTIGLGSEQIRSTEIKTEAGTGYFKKKYEGRDVKNDMGTIKVKVETPGNKNEGVSWGAVYWQYFEDLDKITASATPLSLKKQLFIERNTDRGPVLTEISEGNMLAVGDKVKVRIELRVDRDMEYVHMKDMRAACFEPVNVLSQYKYQGGLGYYESTKDVSTNFFFDYLRKGTYVFEYPVFVAAKGNFSNGISTIQCMYAPEFSSHSEGIRVEVK